MWWTLEVSPWTRALREDRALPSLVFGPVDFSALARLAASFWSETAAMSVRPFDRFPRPIGPGRTRTAGARRRAVIEHYRGKRPGRSGNRWSETGRVTRRLHGRAFDSMVQRAFMNRGQRGVARGPAVSVRRDQGHALHDHHQGECGFRGRRHARP